MIDIDIDVSRHIDELISEWEQCREDERSAQNQQVQVIATAGAILGGVYTVAAIILKGADQSTIRALFYISSITLLVAVAYIVTIGISNVLRYHYMRDLEDRLYQLIPHEPEDMLFTHWMSFCSPITTRNPLHITTSIYTVIHYCCYAVAALGGVAFCIMMIILQYDFVPKHNVWDRIVFQSTLLFMPIALGIFIWISVKAEKMYALSAKKAAEKRYSRFSVQQIQVFKAGTQKHIWSIFSYFFYPKKKDFQKGLLIAAGFAAGAGVSGGNRELSRVLQDGFFCWILLDFLIYQARYLWNDIRGASEDMAAGKTGRLPVRELGLRKAAAIATAVIVLRLVLALMLIHRLEQELQEVFFFSFCVIAVISIVYEIARTKEWDRAVFLFVSLGYPIRIFSGFWAACPGMWKEPFFCGGREIPFSFVLLLFSVYLCVGEISAVLPWTHEAVIQTKNGKSLLKSHYRFLFSIMSKRYQAALGKLPFLPLREKGKLSDLWNGCYLVGILCLILLDLSLGCSGRQLICEALILVCSLKLCTAVNGGIVACTVLSVMMILVKNLVIFQWDVLHLLVMAHQILFVGLYFILRYCFDPEYDFFVVLKGGLRMFGDRLLFLYVGKDTYEHLSAKLRKH